jgi:FkbM family methyltransferase
MDLITTIRMLPRPLRRRRLLRLLSGIVPNSSSALITFNGGATLYGDVNDALVWETVQSDAHYPQYLELAGACLAGGGTYFDVGANIGFLTFGIFPVIDPILTKFHLFEASEANCRLLRRSAAHHRLPSMLINRVCVTDVTGTSRLVTSGERAQGYVSDHGSEEVPNLRLDDYVREFRIPRVDLLKLDVEGWEAHAITGFQQAISQGRVPIVYTELSGESLLRAGWTATRYLTLLNDFDYSCYVYRLEDLDGNPLQRRRLEIRGRQLEVAELDEVKPDCHTDILAVHSSAFASGTVNSLSAAR